MPRADAEALLASIVRTLNGENGQIPVELFTFKSFVEKVYLPIYREKWKASMAETEEYRLRAHLVKSIGDQLLHRIDRDRLKAVLNGAARTVGHDVLDHLRFRLRSIFELAISEGLIDWNPATSLFTPRHQEGSDKAGSGSAQIVLILEALDIPERLISRFAIFEGMRPSEILGLQRHDLDVDSVWVRRRMFKSNVDTPKNQRSAKRIGCSLGTRDLLKTWVASLVSTEDDAWLFPASTLTTPMRLNNLWRRNFVPKN